MMPDPWNTPEGTPRADAAPSRALRLNHDGAARQRDEPAESRGQRQVKCRVPTFSPRAARELTEAELPRWLSSCLSNDKSLA